MPQNTPFPPISKLIIKTDGIQKLLHNLNPNKAAGPDEIKPRFLKELSHEIAPILTIIFEKSIKTGVVPEDWKTAHVSPVYKKGQKYNPENYRPISLTCICCKLLEHIIVKHIMKHADNHNILYPLQHGFRRGRSCETQLIEFIDDVSLNMENGKQTDILVMDFSKAFDKVSHSLLTNKLHHYGIQGELNYWIQNFLSNRKQAVVLEGEKSEYVAVESGVPQGSVLGPSLFLYYINDIPTGLTSTVRLFADDTIVYLAIKSNSDASTLQKDLDKLASWETTWKMAFHPDKCNVISVTRNKKPFTFNYTLHNHTLEHVTTAKYLGVTISSNLKWDVHINNICKKANSTLGFLRRNLNISSTSIKEQAYKSLVRPSLEYACSVWDPYLQQDIDNIEKVQRRAARFVTNKYRNISSVGNMLQHLEWRSLSDRRKDSRLVMLYKIEHEKVAIPKNNILIPQTRQTRHSNSNSFQIPSCKTQYRKESFFPRTITDWNKLPDNIVNCTSVESFKSSISKHQY